MSTTIHRYPLMIRESDLDVFGHVNNATYLTLFEEARWQIITERGFGLKHVMTTGIGPVILEINIKYIKELQVREEVVIESESLPYENKVGRLNQRMMRGDEVCSVAEITYALFSLKERKIILPTEEWLHAVGLDASRQ